MYAKKVSAKNQYTHTHTHISDSTQRWSLYHNQTVLKCQCCHVWHSRFSRFEIIARRNKEENVVNFFEKNHKTESRLSSSLMQNNMYEIIEFVFETKIKVMIDWDAFAHYACKLIPCYSNPNMVTVLFASFRKIMRNEYNESE